MSPSIPERPLRALVWLILQGEPKRWDDIVDISGGYRPGFYQVIQPLIDRGLVREVIDPNDEPIRRVRFEPTDLGRRQVSEMRWCPTCSQRLPRVKS